MVDVRGDVLHLTTPAAVKVNKTLKRPSSFGHQNLNRLS